jgi:hypothetical protein
MQTQDTNHYMISPKIRNSRIERLLPLCKNGDLTTNQIPLNSGVDGIEPPSKTLEISMLTITLHSLKEFIGN